MFKAKQKSVKVKSAISLRIYVFLNLPISSKKAHGKLRTAWLDKCQHFSDNRYIASEVTA